MEHGSRSPYSRCQMVPPPSWQHLTTGREHHDDTGGLRSMTNDGQTVTEKNQE